MPAFEAKLAFLQTACAWGDPALQVSSIETHMSWVFLVGERVFKLKKPVRFPYLDFTTLPARELYCREELRLNTRLAPGVYLGLMALQWDGARFTLVPELEVTQPWRTVDWLVVMRRLPAPRMLQAMMAQGVVATAEVDGLIDVLSAFYRNAPRVAISPCEYLVRFQREHACNREVLLRPQFDLPDAVRALDDLDRVLLREGPLLQARARSARIVDGHGDLRAEHVCLLQPPVVIDCLEFNPALRAVDPFDELAYLELECALAGAAWIGPRLVAGCAAQLGDQPCAGLLSLYTAHRALLRARLAVAHLLDPVPRTPERWAPLAQRYVDAARTALAAVTARPTHGCLRWPVPAAQPR